MKIREITFQLGNDFHANLECEHCPSTQSLDGGYNDDYFHKKVVPAITCKACGKNSAGEVPEVKNDLGNVPA